jgi:lipopolysaccharide transport system permease protein
MSRKEPLVVIEPGASVAGINVKEIWRFKDLLYFMVLRDVTVLYKQTVLGFAWAIINPLFQIVIFSLVFGTLAGVRPDIGDMPYPVFSSLAVIPWTYFANSVNLAGSSLISASAIFTKVYFPRIIIPLTPVFSKLIDLCISFAILIGLMIFYKYQPGANITFMLVPLLLVIVTAAGLGFWISALSVQYRDFKFALSFMLPILMYVAPVAFPASLVLQKFGSTAFHLYALYPMVGAIEGFRTSFATAKPMPWDLIATSWASAVVIFLSGVWYFRKMERHFADLA